MLALQKKYIHKCCEESVLYEHLPILKEYADKCSHITEMGISLLSCYAFAVSLVNRKNTKFVQINKDPLNTQIIEFQKECQLADMNTIFYQSSYLTCPLETTDLLFIDTWHVYGQTKRELAYWKSHVQKYIILHDTTIDGELGETIRMRMNAEEQSKTTGIPINEIHRGIWPAIVEFIQENPQWIIEKRLMNNFGLTILKRCDKLHPISFSIPQCKVIHSIPPKIRTFAYIIPGNISTYIYNTEEEYYKGYQESIFGKTSMKAGWDCLRHYEILANGCIPWFDNLELCPPNTLHNFPKQLVLDAMRSGPERSHFFIEKLIEHTQKYLTTYAVAQYILETIGQVNSKSCLYLSSDARVDYLRCLTLHGFKEIFGKDCHDATCVEHLYTDFNDTYSLYGKGMSCSKLLDKVNYRDNQRDKTLIQDISSHKYDFVIYGSVHRDTFFTNGIQQADRNDTNFNTKLENLPFWETVNQAYLPSEIVLLCGEDHFECGSRVHDCCFKKYADMYNVFIREL